MQCSTRSWFVKLSRSDLVQHMLQTFDDLDRTTGEMPEDEVLEDEEAGQGELFGRYERVRCWPDGLDENCNNWDETECASWTLWVENYLLVIEEIVKAKPLLNDSRMADLMSHDRSFRVIAPLVHTWLSENSGENTLISRIEQATEGWNLAFDEVLKLPVDNVEDSSESQFRI